LALNRLFVVAGGGFSYTRSQKMAEVERMAVPESAMIIVAHPDDAEFMAAGTLAKWAREGCRVYYCIVTNGNKGSDDETMTPAKLQEIRAQEQRDAAEVIGAQDVIFLDHEDGMLQNTLDVRRDIVRVLRQYRPCAVICFDPTTRFLMDNYINHPDHRASGDVTLDAVFPSARDRLMFPELLEQEGLQPHKVREVYLGATENPNHWEDITSTMSLKAEALRRHPSQLGEFDIDGALEEFGKLAAQGTDFEYAESFRKIVLD
jgi:LmbE family N-acetylglucosaminyl deacetylase